MMLQRQICPIGQQSEKWIGNLFLTPVSGQCCALKRDLVLIFVIQDITLFVLHRNSNFLWIQHCNPNLMVSNRANVVKVSPARSQ